MAVILAAQFMAVLDMAVVNVAMPSIKDDLGASGAGLQMVIAGYVIAYAVLLVTGARLGDRLGQRRMFMLGLAGFTVASLACGLAWSTGSLVAFRFGQGIGAAMMVPQIMTLIQVTFAGEARGRALSRYAAVISGGAVAGQVIGGLVVTADLFDSSWRGVFLLNVPIGLVLLVIAPRVLPGGSARPGHSLDFVGLVLLSPAVLLLVVPLVLGHENGWPLWGWICLALSPVVLGIFIRAERRVAARGGAPLFPGRVLRAKGLVPAALAQHIVMTTFSGSLLVMAIHLQTTLGYTALHAGLLFIPMASLFAVSSMTWGRLPKTVLPVLIPGALVAAGVLTAILGLQLRGGGDFGVAESVVFALAGLSYGYAFSPLMATALGRVPLDEAADASGFLTTVVQLGNVVGVATFGTLFLTRMVHDVPHASAKALSVTNVAEGIALLGAAALAVVATRASRTS